jgi:hypothetical protein
MLWMTYGSNWFIHFGAVSECLPKIGGRATCNMETGSLDIRARGRRVELFPQFGLFRPTGGVGYAQAPVESAQFFVGWRPYVNRVWPLSFDKRAFKAFCSANGVAVPRLWTRPEDVDADVLIKRAVSSFSEGICGPYAPAVLRSSGRVLARGEFFEEFILGDIVKVWYWNATPVCLEVLPMPTVTGDGVRTLRQLINRIKIPHIDCDWQECQAIVDYQGLSVDAIVPGGQEVLVDFRYRSILHPVLTDFPNTNVLAKFTGTPVMEQLGRSGEVFWQGIPEGVRQNTLFTVDGILDRNGTIRFCEINSNPAVHPDVYPVMLETIFARDPPQMSAPLPVLRSPPPTGPAHLWNEELACPQ